MQNVEIATLVVALAQIIGLVAVISGGGPAAAIITGIAGFAAVVNLFLPSGPTGEWYKKLKLVAGICGGGLIIFAIVSVA